MKVDHGLHCKKNEVSGKLEMGNFIFCAVLQLSDDSLFCGSDWTFQWFTKTVMLKELRNCIPRIIRVWSLICSIQAYEYRFILVCIFYRFFWKTSYFVFLSFLCFLPVLCLYHCIIIVYIVVGVRCSVFLFSLI